jgi:hypothetical protein
MDGTSYNIEYIIIHSRVTDSRPSTDMVEAALERSTQNSSQCHITCRVGDYFAGLTVKVAV